MNHISYAEAVQKYEAETENEVEVIVDRNTEGNSTDSRVGQNRESMQMVGKEKELNKERAEMLNSNRDGRKKVGMKGQTGRDDIQRHETYAQIHSNTSTPIRTKTDHQYS